ncbi:shikimate dehydrogenase [Corynebacterium poyangense]|uniref:Shikimate dehydrogenase (NADP(+)) n=1 Tax=Corynebacterium poyangense TaxID=2684405 RepID=A0A7H0SQI8_9CORY|nr:shikimate dehydrogenase [Corynebacterium poyangense]QNQ90813.1 shikimate dehydrogenase [Corynebacterium poyangense]
MKGFSMKTYLLGLIGHGIGLSRTPKMHEIEGFHQGCPIVYRIIDTLLLKRSINEVLESAIDFGFQGLNITHPHKQEIIPLLDEIDPVAASINAVNTVVIKDGKTIGYNTDVTGYGRSLPGEISGEVVVQIGAGGAGNAVAYALVAAGVKRLMIADMDENRSRLLADNINSALGVDKVEGIGLTALEESIAASFGVVNATPMGMQAHPGTSFDTSWLTPRHWVSDVVYMPVETQLLREARALGCKTLDGTGMAVGQAVDAFRIFTGREADPARMREAFLQQGQERKD